jgi:hypothetical protein
MTKDSRENEQLPKTEGILRGGNDDRRKDGSNGLSIKTGSFTYNKSPLLYQSNEINRAPNRPLVVSFCLKHVFFILDYFFTLEPKFSP